MPSLEISSAIAAPSHTVFALFTDLEHAAEHIGAIQKLELLTPGPMRKGTRFRETRVMFGKEATEEMEVVDFVPGQSYTVAAGSCGARFTSRFDFRAEGGGTRVEMRIEAVPVSWFAKLLSPLSGLMMKSCKKAFEKDLEDLKAVAEGKARGAALAR